MLKIGLIREGKIPVDTRVALIPSQCRWLQRNFKDLSIKVQSSANRCYTDKEYQAAGIEVSENVNDCDILFGIKEIPVDQLLAGKSYFFFSHTKKLQPHNRDLLQA